MLTLELLQTQAGFRHALAPAGPGKEWWGSLRLRFALAATAHVRSQGTSKAQKSTHATAQLPGAICSYKAHHNNRSLLFWHHRGPSTHTRSGRGATPAPGPRSLHHEALRLRGAAQAQRCADDVAAREHAHQAALLIHHRQPADLRTEDMPTLTLFSRNSPFYSPVQKLTACTMKHRSCPTSTVKCV